MKTEKYIAGFFTVVGVNLLISLGLKLLGLPNDAAVAPLRVIAGFCGVILLVIFIRAIILSIKALVKKDEA